MIVSIELPDDFAEALVAKGDLSRRVLEALAVEGYRQHTLRQLQVGRMLGLARIETELFLAQHVDLYECDPSELDREAEALQNLSEGLSAHDGYAKPSGRYCSGCFCLR